MRAFVIVDMQNDFMPGGALGVPQADQLIPIINRLIPQFSLVVATQDWHPSNHVSFAANHQGKKTGERIRVEGEEQILWPVHCVRNTEGAALVEGLQKSQIACAFFKGTDEMIDSYSAFFDNAHLKSTGLGEYLKTHGVDEVVIAGVATDYCVLYSVLDALQLGFRVVVVTDACLAINVEPDDDKRAFAAMQAKGAKLLLSSQV
jgi:nicotinamidase/pyrazinamidase